MFLKKVLVGIEKYKLIRRLVLVWAVVLITAVVVRVFWWAPNIPESTAHAMEIVIGLLLPAIAFYKWTRYDEDKTSRKEEGEEGNDE